MYKKYVFLLLTWTLFSSSFARQNEVRAQSGSQEKNTTHYIADVEFLYWYAGVTSLSYATKGKTIAAGQTTSPSTTFFVPTKKEEFNREWDPGVRLGLDVVTPYEGWDVYTNWTYFYDSYSDVSSVPVFSGSDFSGAATPNPVGTKALRSTWFLTPNGEFFQKMEARWALLFNQIDVELGRKFWVGCFLSLRPFIGFRGYWSRMYFRVEGSRPLAANADYYDARSAFNQKRWGVGLLTGLDTAWEFARCWSVFANGSFSLPYGRTGIRRRASEYSTNSAGAVVQNIKVTTEDAFYSTQPILDFSLGIRWEKAFDCFRLLFDGGWESHYLVDYNQLFRGTQPSAPNTGLPSTNGDLTMAGIVIRGRVEF